MKKLILEKYFSKDHKNNQFLTLLQKTTKYTNNKNDNI